jgi:hypothetical protein
MWLAIAVMLSSAPSPALHHAAERAREAVITTCHISGDRLAIEQDEGSSLYSVGLKGSEPLSDAQIRCFARTIGSAGDAVALSIENESLGARYDRLGQRDTLANARAVIRRHGVLGRLPRFDRHRGTLAAFAIRLERLCGAQARSVLRVKHGRIALRRDAPRMTGRRAAREFCAVNAAIASGHNPLYVPVIPMLHIDPPPLPIPEAPASEKRP